MTQAQIRILAKSTVEIDLEIPWEDVKTTYEKLFSEAAKDTEVEGFRKGKAPKDLAAKHIDASQIYQDVIKTVVPQAIQKAIQDHALHPITSPKIEAKSVKEGETWKFMARIAVKPPIQLGKYKEAIREMKKPKPKIWKPGDDMSRTEEKKESKPSLDAILDALLSSVSIEFSDILIEEEVNRLLSDLLDQTKQLGLSVEQYLVAKGKTTDQIRIEYRQQAEKSLTIQFALMEIADSEHITVEQADFDALLAKVEKPEERERLKKDSYYLAHLIRQQKTLDFLSNLQ